ncbi:magnesium protoporphyrin IX methyltransferase [Albimonas sp. CAU 1670]|uniref:magnesium protoporphyrin IX methyltransferase n=1 Tax=Albimonas sp. CAU 1670 TaxID=3032599 RepID=UPI0023DA2283|nr:magnesium protoporphyrin IX methyltransferase [Albimonas sp. CAU 1670]MDF2231509.1 magnesium protoporphyrin IX methyltransferase [Albimonas sp. CAU 1670]
MDAAWTETRDRLAAYFDRTAFEAWAKLTSDAPVSRIRATVRAGRGRMRAALLAALPADLSGRRVLDAGCGVGQLSLEAALRGAQVLGVDISDNLLSIARGHAAEAEIEDVAFVAGDMRDPAHGRFDHVVAMDSLIHYRCAEIVDALAALAPRTARSIVFTVAPRTPLLSLMHAAGKAFPRADRAPAIVPVSARALARAVAARPELAGWSLRIGPRISTGFYISQAMELRR